MSILRSIEISLLTPKLLFSKSAADYYAFLGDDLIEGTHDQFRDPNKPLWLNLGYWKTARTYPAAAEALACLLGDAAQLGPGDEVLDAGFGFADQDFLWIERYGVARIAGLNITPLHVERARERVRQRGLESRIDLQLGSATEMPFAAASFDQVVALESAFHFNTRQHFFEEAFRVLRPGGRLATADGGRASEEGPLNMINRLALKRWCVPVENMYDSDEYRRRLEAVGFVNVTCESIRNYVFPGCLKYKTLRQKGVPMDEAVVELTREEIDTCWGLEQWRLTGFTDYLIFAADKPA